MLTVPSYNIVDVFSDDCIRYLNILYKHNMGSIAKSIIDNDYINDMTAIYYVDAYRKHILDGINDESDYEFVKKFDVLSSFITMSHVSIEYPYHVPNYNLHNTGAICHLNSCISMLSSMTHLIKEMNSISETNSTDYIFQLLKSYINNSYSHIDINTHVIHELMQLLSISRYEYDEATETMKKIIRVLYINNIPMSTVYYWDASNEFFNSKNITTLGLKLKEIKPMYFIVNAHDLNVLFDYETEKIKIKEFDIPDNKHYTLKSIISFNGNHLTTMFYVNENTFKVIDDLSNRYHSKYISSKELFNDSSSHVIGCYIRN